MTVDPENFDNADDADEGDDRADRIVLRASAFRWVWVLIGSMAFVAFGVALALGAETSGVAQVIGWILVLLFVFCAVVALRQMIDPGSLVISRTTIDMLRRGRLTSFEFADCGEFTTWRNPSRGTTFVVFDHLPDGDTEIHRANRHAMGGTRLFIDNYGMSPDALADLLNSVREQQHRS